MRGIMAGFLIVAGCSAEPTTPTPTGMGMPAVAGLKAVAITPANQLLVIDGAPAVQAYQARGTFSDGHEEDITNRVTFTLDASDLGSFKNEMLTTTAAYGGITNVTVHNGDVSGSTPVTIMIRQRIADPSSGASEAAFSGAEDPARAPKIVYPGDGVLMPPNFGHVEVHFVPGAGNTQFEVGFANTATDVRVYTGCGTPVNGGCVFLIPDAVWKTVATTNRGTQQVTITVRGTDGKVVGRSKPVGLEISRDDILGGIYYWTTSNGTGIMRYDFGALNPPAQAEKYVGTNFTGGKCVGCHALSRDGSKLVAEAGGQDDGRLLLLNVANTKPIVPFGSTAKSIFESWDPMGDQFVGVYGDRGATDFNLLIFNGNSGSVLMPIAGTGTADHPADHPDWAPDGQHIVYTRVGLPNTLQRMSYGAIDVVPYNGAWGTPSELVPAEWGKNRYYPAFSPDSSFVVFDESTCQADGSGTDCDADTDPTATLYAVRLSGGKIVGLDKANAGGALDQTQALTNSFPKWSPFVFKRTGEAGSRLMWLTFSSSRYYGLRKPPASSGDQTSTGTLIWMAAVDPDAIANGLDGSYPAFALPFQDYTTSNHIAQWTQTIVPVIP